MYLLPDWDREVGLSSIIHSDLLSATSEDYDGGIGKGSDGVPGC